MDEDDKMIEITVGWINPDGTTQNFEYLVPTSLKDYIDDLHRQIEEQMDELDSCAIELQDYANKFQYLRPSN